jgi:hypothetical protein
LAGRHPESNYVYSATDQVGGESIQAVILPLSPAKFDPDILTVDKARLLEAEPDGRDVLPICGLRRRRETSDDWDCRLLRARRAATLLYR